MKVCGVYAIEHVPTGRLYVGKGVDVDRRIRQHLAGYGGGVRLQNAVRE